MHTQRLQPRDTAEAAEILRRGGLLGIPTETVYGLGANGLNPDAVGRIFAAKGRPQDNPLILHIPSADWLERYCGDIPDTAYALAERFWPGPLTMVLRRKRVVPDVVTAGLDTVGMRCPAHPVCRAILAAADVPVAAPSGNTSGRPSPTNMADMLEDMDGKIQCLVDGGPCAVGVESTILDLTCTPPRLLRPGGVPVEQIERLIGPIAIDKAVNGVLDGEERPRAPGMKYRHYAPHADLQLVEGETDRVVEVINNLVKEKLAEGKKVGVICTDETRVRYPQGEVRSVGLRAKEETIAHNLFAVLREFDDLNVDCIYSESFSKDHLGQAIMNRLTKAAGYHILNV